MYNSPNFYLHTWEKFAPPCTSPNLLLMINYGHLYSRYVYVNVIY